MSYILALKLQLAACSGGGDGLFDAALPMRLRVW